VLFCCEGAGGGQTHARPAQRAVTLIYRGGCVPVPPTETDRQIGAVAPEEYFAVPGLARLAGLPAARAKGNSDRTPPASSSSKLAQLFTLTTKVQQTAENKTCH